jgi:hypothetical protein
MSILFYIGELMEDYDKAVLAEMEDKKAEEE